MAESLSLGDVCSAIVDCEHKTVPIDPSGSAWAVGTPAMINGKIDFSKAKRISWKTYEEWTRRLRPSFGDLILAREAPVGQTVRVPRDVPVALGQRTVLLRPDEGRIESRYLHFLLLSTTMQVRMHSKAEGSTVAHLNVSDIRDLALPDLPGLPAQRAIAEMLGALDDKIESNRRQVNNFDKMMVLSYENAPRSRTVNASSILQPVLGGTPSRAQKLFWNGDIKWVSAKDISNSSDGCILKSEESITKLGLENSTARVLPAGTTVITARGTVGALARLVSAMAFNQSCYGLVPVAGFPSLFVYLAIREKVTELKRVSHGTVFDTLSMDTFRRLEISIPDQSVEQALLTEVKAYDSSITALLRQSEVLSEVRNVLLPVLLSGSLRVPDELSAVKELV